MEVWILLAAAGSGYLARRWQNAQRPKGSSADEAEDDNGAGPSDYMPTNRGHYRRFSSSARRQVGKSIYGKGSPYWVRSKNAGNLSEYKTGSKGMAEVGGSTASREGHVCNSDGKACEIYTAARNVDQRQTHGHNKDDSQRSSLEQVISDGLSSMRISSSQEGKSHLLLKDRQRSECDTQEEEDGKGYTVLFRSASGKRANDSLDVKVRRGGQMHEDGYAGKRMKDATANTNPANNPEEGYVFGSRRPGFWDVSEGMFVLDTDSLLVQQLSKGRSSSRKSRTSNRYSKSRSLRRRNLTGRKPMSSLESCLSAQLREDYNRQTVQSRELFGDASFWKLEKHAISHTGSLIREGKVGVPRTEFAIGLPSLSRQASSKKFPSKSRTPKSGEPFNPFESRLLKEKFPYRRFQGRKGRAVSSKGLLFNFGVGVGIMFTVMSNMREVKRLTMLLKEAESLIKDLDDELERKDEMQADPGVFKGKGRVEARLGLEQRQNVVTNTLRKVRSATESLCSMRRLLTNEPRSSLQHAPSKDMSKLEAELEAELERMELSLGDGDALSTRYSELDGEVGDLVHGDLTILGLPHEVEKDSDDEDGSSSSHEDGRARNFAVSPRLLAKRLQEVLEAQQEQRISELETELKLLSTKLQAKEEEVRGLKENPRGISSGDLESSSSMEKKPQQSLRSRSRQKYFPGTEDLSIANEDARQISLLPRASPVSPQMPGNDASVFRKDMENKSTTFITLGGEALAAYKEACMEFSEVSCDPVGPFSPVNRKPERQTRDAFAQDGKADAKQLRSADGWEQVDLLSLAEDFYVSGDQDLLEHMPVAGWSSSSRGRRGAPRRKSRNKGHPEPEQAFPSSKGVDSSDDATNDTSVSTPCSVKFIDVRTVDYYESEEQQGGEKGESDSSGLPSYGDWGREVSIRAGVNTPTREEYRRHPSESKHSLRQFPPCSKQGGWGLPDDSDNYSELDEQLGQLLIKRIVEKTRKGSPIVQDAQTALASLEKNEPVRAVD